MGGRGEGEERRWGLDLVNSFYKESKSNKNIIVVVFLLWGGGRLRGLD